MPVSVLRFHLVVVLSVMALVACGDDRDTTSTGATSDTSGADSSTGDGEESAVEVDTSGACGVICEGGELQCEVEGFDPADGLEACTLECQAEWANEAECAGPAEWVLECVRANGSCDTLDDETCGTGVSSVLTDLLNCIDGVE